MTSPEICSVPSGAVTATGRMLSSCPNATFAAPSKATIAIIDFIALRPAYWFGTRHRISKAFLFGNDLVDAGLLPASSISVRQIDTAAERQTCEARHRKT